MVDCQYVRGKRSPVLPANPSFSGGAQKPHHTEPLSRSPQEIDPQPVSCAVIKAKKIFFSDIAPMLNHLARDGFSDYPYFGRVRVNPHKPLLKRPLDPKPIIDFVAVTVFKERVKRMMFDFVKKPRHGYFIEIFN